MENVSYKFTVMDHYVVVAVIMSCLIRLLLLEQALLTFE